MMPRFSLNTHVSIYGGKIKMNFTQSYEIARKCAIQQLQIVTGKIRENYLNTL